MCTPAEHTVIVNSMRSGEIQHARPVIGVGDRDVELPSDLHQQCHAALHQSYIDYNEHCWEFNELTCAQREIPPPEGHIYAVTAEVGEQIGDWF